MAGKAKAADRRIRFTEKEKSWIKYDVGNSAFVMLSATLIPIYFAALAGPESSIVVAWGFTESAASLLIALLMPFLGNIADVMGNKKKFLLGTAGTGIVACAALGIPLSASAFLVVYLIANVMLNSSMVFYDAFLVDAAQPQRRHAVSSAGYAWGYIGSCIPFVTCLVIVLFGDRLGISTLNGIRLSFLITALWWLAFTIPLLRKVKQVHGRQRSAFSRRTVIPEVLATLKYITKTKHLLLFMLAYFFYIDGVHTIIKMAVSFGSELGLDSTMMVLALLLTQIIAFPATIVYGRLAQRFGAWRMISISTLCYAAIVFYAAFFLQSSREFWILAVAVGLFQGGIQAISRSYFSEIIPPDHADEFYGIFDIFGKYAAALGTFLIGFVTMITGNAQIGVFSLCIMFVIAFVLLMKMPRFARF